MILNIPRVSEKDLSTLSHHNQVAFALFCAKQVIHLVEPKHKEVANKCIEVVHLWFEGKATKEDCAVAAATYASTYAATYTANYTANAAAAAVAVDAVAYTTFAAAASAYAASASASAAAAAYAADDKETIIKAQWGYYNELLKLDSYLVEGL